MVPPACVRSRQVTDAPGSPCAFARGARRRWALWRRGAPRLGHGAARISRQLRHTWQNSARRVVERALLRIDHAAFGGRAVACGDERAFRELGEERTTAFDEERAPCGEHVVA